HERVDQRHRRAAQCRDEHRDDQRERRPRMDALDRPEAHHRADEHHPFDAEVEHAGPLREQLAERAEEERRAVRDTTCDQRDEQRVVHDAAPAGAVGADTRGVRTMRTRWRTNSSPPSAENRMIPWITPTRPDGKLAPCSVLPALSSPPIRNAISTT